MAQPRPSCTLVLDIDEKLATNETRLEVDRCYTHVGTAIVRTHATAEGDARENVMRLLAKLGNRHYLKSSEPGADELWEGSIERWFHNQFHTVSNNMRIYNRRQREIGNDELRFDWLECDMENGALRVALRLDSTCSVPAENAGLLTSVRSMINDGSLGEGVVRIAMPSAESWAAQLAAGEAAAQARRAEAEAQAKALAEEAEAAKAKAEEEAAEGFLESPELAAQGEGDAAEADQEAPSAPEFDRFEEEVPDFAVDYRMWEIEYEDGSKRIFNSAEARFVDEEEAR